MATTTYPGSATDRAAQIRAALKRKGWTSRDVSIRAEYYSMGSSIHVRIKNPDVPLAPVEQAANEHEHIDRDGYGEILSGGNRFVHVSYSHEAAEVLSARYLDIVKAAAAVLDSDGRDNSLHPIGDTGYLIGRGHRWGGYSLWGNGGHIQSANETTTIAYELAVRLQKAVR